MGLFPGAGHDLRGQYVARVKANVPLCREHYRLVLSLDAFPPTGPGQFVQVACRDLAGNFSPETEMDWEPGRPWACGQELMSPLGLLRRPFSLAGRRDVAGGVELDLIHRVVGVGTGWLARLETGDTVHILGPLGNRFTLPPADGVAILVGGGVGIPPMLYLAERLAGRRAAAFCGALSSDLLPLTLTAAPPSPDAVEPVHVAAEFSIHGIPSVLTTDDGSYGFRGFVTQALEKYLDQSASVRPPTLYTCGPELMIKRVAQIAADRGIEVQVAVERAMACGMGTCQSCVIRLKRQPNDPAGRGRDWGYKLACTDGPVFRGADLLW